MGVFYSYCQNCGKRIEWFLFVPEDCTCKQCGVELDEEVFQDIHMGNLYHPMLDLIVKMKPEHNWYSNHVEDMILRFRREHLLMYPALDLSTLKYAFDYEDVYQQFVKENPNG